MQVHCLFILKKSIRLQSVHSSVNKHLTRRFLQGLSVSALIFLFMLVYYRLPGLVAVITLSVYIFIILLVFTLINGVLTLPGIAALMLGVGMAVDANILTYERIREELRVGKSVKTSFMAGAKHAFTAILDANITTILAAVVLFIFGTSSVKGFATILIISILASFLTAVWGSRITSWGFSSIVEYLMGKQDVRYFEKQGSCT